MTAFDFLVTNQNYEPKELGRLLELLRAPLHSESQPSRILAVGIIQGLGKAARPLADELRRLIQTDPNRHVREEAMLALASVTRGHQGVVSATPPIEEIESAVALLEGMSAHDIEAMREAASQEILDDLLCIAYGMPEYGVRVRHAIEELSHSQLMVYRLKAAELIFKLGSDAVDLAQVAGELLTDPSSAVRMRAVAAVLRTGSMDGRVQQVIELLDEGDPLVRNEAVRALGWVLDEDARVAAKLALEQHFDPQLPKYERSGIEAALARLDRDPERLRAERTALNRPRYSGVFGRFAEAD